MPAAVAESESTVAPLAAAAVAAGSEPAAVAESESAARSTGSRAPGSVPVVVAESGATVAPAGAPPENLTILNKAFATVLRDPEVLAQLNA